MLALATRERGCGQLRRCQHRIDRGPDQGKRGSCLAAGAAPSLSPGGCGGLGGLRRGLAARGAARLMLAATAPGATWDLTRSAGAVSLLLLTATVFLGVVDVRRWASPSWPRFVIDSLHRNVALLAVCFLAVPIVTSVLDGFPR